MLNIGNELAPVNGAFDLKILVNLVVLYAIGFVLTVLLAKNISGKYDSKKTNTTVILILLNTVISLMLMLLFGCSSMTIKGILLAMILEYASFSDIKTRECADFVHLMILCISFIGIDLAYIPYMLLSSLFCGGVMLFVAILYPKQIGGADIKAVGSMAFLLGFTKGLIGLIIGLSVAVISNSAKEKRNKSFPMIPYLAAGFMAAYFM